MAAVRRLDSVLVDRIAAGEVVERPASAVKELVENALDAGARSVEIAIEAGGRRLIRIVGRRHRDGGDDLRLAVERHATSKLPDGDLSRIATLGFRGEALPSIGAVSRLSIVTRRRDAGTGAALVVDGGVKGPARPAAAAPGTRIEVSDLFSATPARLKFLSPTAPKPRRWARRSGGSPCPTRRSVSRSAATVSPRLPSRPSPTASTGCCGALARVLGPEFGDNAVRVDAERDGWRITGFAGLPTFHRAGATGLHFVVNGRPVRDRLLLGAVRGAYADTVPAGRYPVAALSLVGDPRRGRRERASGEDEVRFRDEAGVRSLVVAALREAIGRSGTAPRPRAARDGGRPSAGWAGPNGSRGPIRATAPRPSGHLGRGLPGLRRKRAGLVAELSAPAAEAARPPRTPTRSTAPSRGAGAVAR
jgi:DNA mismatch repair protein MutL